MAGVWYSQLALVSLDALGGAEALACVGVTQWCVPVALAGWGEGKGMEVTTGLKDHHYHRLFLKHIILSELDSIGKTLEWKHLKAKIQVFQLTIYLKQCKGNMKRTRVQGQEERERWLLLLSEATIWIYFDLLNRLFFTIMTHSPGKYLWSISRVPGAGYGGTDSVPAPKEMLWVITAPQGESWSGCTQPPMRCLSHRDRVSNPSRAQK